MNFKKSIKMKLQNNTTKKFAYIIALQIFTTLTSLSCHQTARAFLFHQLQPLTLASSSSGQYPRNVSTTDSEFVNNFHQNQAPIRQQQASIPIPRFNQAVTTQQQISPIPELAFPTGDEGAEKTSLGCPAECHCNKAAQIADCSNKNLIRVPNGFPKDIKRIRLERNNITELGPYAFQGLKRLQRIDLSNNKLNRIDPLAFAGGLQSLNSLILYSNKLNQLPANLFSELSQLQLLLLNANSIQCINRELFASLTNLNLLSLYDNNIETLSNGTFDGLKNIKTIHLGKNPLVCDCNLRWLADYLELNPIETSDARCEAPTRNGAKKLSQLSRNRFRCEGNEAQRTAQLANQCAQQDQSCPLGCTCNGATVDCSQSNVQTGSSANEAATSSAGQAGNYYELPDVPDDIPVYVTRMKINDSRIKRIRQTGLFRRLANSQKLDLGNNRIIDIEDNAIANGQATSGSSKPDRVVFVLLENEHCNAREPGDQQAQASRARVEPANEDPCSTAPRVNGPRFDSPCYNGGSCVSSVETGSRGGGGGSSSISRQGGSFGSEPGVLISSNYSCLCPPGFAGPLCEVNIDDCADHQCQNGAMCVDGINSYRCVCRDPTTSGEFCEQLNVNTGNNFVVGQGATSSANSIAPMALPMVASGSSMVSSFGQENQQATSSSGFGNSHNMYSANAQTGRQQHHQSNQQILARSADFLPALPRLPVANEDRYSSIAPATSSSMLNSISPSNQGGYCKRRTQRRFYDDGNGCQSIRMLKMGECVGICTNNGNNQPTRQGCCKASEVKRRRVRMQCSDGASYVKTIDLIKKCTCSSECSPMDSINASGYRNQPSVGLSHFYNATQEDQSLQIARVDAVD